MRKWFFVLLCLTFNAGCSFFQPNDDVVTFEDPLFEAIIIQSIEDYIDPKFDAPVTIQDMRRLGKYLKDAPLDEQLRITSEVKSVEGIEYAEGLYYLFIHSSDVDLSAIQLLESLQGVSIATNSLIEDIRPLQGVQDLSIILTEFDPQQIQAFSKLKRIFVESAEVSTNDVLENLIHNTELTSLSLHGSEESTINIALLSHFPKLEYLDLEEAQIGDIGILETLTHLKEVSLVNNLIQEIHGLAKLEYLEFVDLTHNPLGEGADEIIEELEERGITVFTEN
jgi:Leucine-rich repeat (LRR) protein